MAGVRLSRVDRRADHRGRRPAPGRRRRGRRDLRPAGRTGPGTRTTTGRRCAYVELDATGVRQQGAGGGPAEGRMAYVGMVCNPGPGVALARREARRRCGRATSRGCTRWRSSPRLLRTPAGARRHGPGRPLDRPVRRRQRPGGPAAGELPARRGGHPRLLPPGGEAHRAGAAAAPRGRGPGRGAGAAVAAVAQGRRRARCWRRC